MKYLCLVYLEEGKLRVIADSECAASGQRLRDNGMLVAAEALQPIDTATTVRVRNGKVAVTDGPFAETKEQLAGFYLIEARDLDEAIQPRRGSRRHEKAASRSGRSETSTYEPIATPQTTTDGSFDIRASWSVRSFSRGVSRLRVSVG